MSTTPTGINPETGLPYGFDLDAFLKMLNSGAEDFIKQAEETKVPGLANRIREMEGEGGGGIEGVGAPFWIRATEEINKAKYDPGAYARDRMAVLAMKYTYGTAQGYDPQFARGYGPSAAANLEEIRALQQYVTKNNYLTNEQIGEALSNGEKSATTHMYTDLRASKSGSFKEAVGFLAPVMLGALFPGLGGSIGSALGLGTGTAATVVGQSIVNTVLNGGDLKSGIMAAAIPVVGKEVAGTVAKTFIESGMDKAVANTVGNVVSNTGIALLQGKDPMQALLAGGVSAGVSAGTSALTNEIPGMSELPDFLKNTINTGITAELLNGNGIQAATNSLLNYKVPIAKAGGSSSTEAPLSEEEQEQLIENRLNKAIGQSQISPEEEDANTQLAIEELERLYGPSATTTPVEETAPATKSLDSSDVVNTLENAGLTETPISSPVDDFFKPTENIEELLVTDKRIEEPTAETPTAEAPIVEAPKESAEEVLVTDKLIKELTEPSYLPTDDDFPATPIKDEGEVLVTDKRIEEPTQPSYLPTDDDFPATPIKDEGEVLVTDKRIEKLTEPSYLPTDDDFPATPIKDEGEVVVVDKRPEKEIPEIEIVDDRPEKEPTTPTPTTPAPKPTTPKPTTPKPTAPAPAPAARAPAKQSAAQQVAPALLGMPQLGNVFYYGKDFSSQKQRLDPSGRLIQQEYKPLSVTQAGAELQLDKIAGTDENDIEALIQQIMASSGGDISPEELAQILGQQGASYG